MRKILFLIIFSAFANLLSFAYDFSAENFNFNFIGSSDNVVLCSQVETTPNVAIPATVTFRGRTFNITNIANGAFRGCNIESVTIPEGVKEIGDNAFRNTKIQQVIMPNSLQKIGEYAFANCPNLKYIEFGKGIVSSRYYRPLQYTFADDNNIEKIVFRGDRPPYHITDYPAFSNTARQFAQIYVPLNGYLHFAKSQWDYCFAKPTLTYTPKGEKPEVVPYAMFYWNNSNVSISHSVKGVRYTFDGDTPIENPCELIIEGVKDEHGNIIYKLQFSLYGNSKYDTFYTYTNQNSDFNRFNGERWFISDPDSDPSKYSILVNFYNGKFSEPKKFLGSYSKNSYKKVDAPIMKVSLDDGKEIREYEFKITELPNGFITLEQPVN